MMARFYQNGNAIDYHNNTTETIQYGEVVKLGGKIGIALEAIPTGAVGSLDIEGIYQMDSDTGTAFAVGDTLYLDNNGKVTKTAGDTVAGWAAYPKESAGTEAYVKINGAAAVKVEQQDVEQ